MIVTDRMMVQLGYVEKLEYHLRKRRNPVMIEIFADVEPDPSVDTVLNGAEAMRKFKPDTLSLIHIYQAGVIKALYDRGINKFNAISGTSIGAVNGYFIFTNNVEKRCV